MSSSNSGMSWVLANWEVDRLKEEPGSWRYDEAAGTYVPVPKDTFAWFWDLFSKSQQAAAQSVVRWQPAREESSIPIIVIGAIVILAVGGFVYAVVTE